MILCADDYGLSEDISLAILELCALGKLSAVSCMIVLERCTPGALEQLLAHQSSVDVGLHLCLTDEGLPLSLSSAGLAATAFSSSDLQHSEPLSPSPQPSPSGRGSSQVPLSEIPAAPDSPTDGCRFPLSPRERVGVRGKGSPLLPASPLAQQANQTKHQCEPGAAQRLPSFGVLLRRALRRQVDSRKITRQVLDQYELFVEKCGRKPDFVDGHLHAHQLPGVREGLLEAVRSLPSDCRPYVRNTRLPLRELWSRRLPWLKAALIGAFGARMFKQLRSAGVPTNDGFAGIYDFRDWHRYGIYFPRFIACLRQPNGILVMHPGSKEEWRREEFATLRGCGGVKGLNRFFYR